MKNIFLALLIMHFSLTAFCKMENESSFSFENSIYQNSQKILGCFIENKGQIKDQNNRSNNSVLYLLNGSEFNVQLRKTGFSYDLYQNVYENDNSEENNGLITGEKTILKEVNYHRIDFEFLEYNPNFEVISEEVNSKYYIYYYSNEGLIKAKNFSKITYKNIYKNIDIEFCYDPALGFKYNFIIHPGGNIHDIQIQLNGANEMKMSNDNLLIETSIGSLIESIPYSEFLESKVKVDVRFVLNNNQLHFETNASITGKTLLIDPYPNPTRKWGTFIGGTGEESSDGGRIDVDINNNIYMVGTTFSSIGIATVGVFQSTLNGARNGIISKFALDGAVQWITYFSSGSSGSAYTELVNLKINGSNLFVVGNSRSGLYVTSGVHQTAFSGGTGLGDGFLAKMDLNGNIVWSSYYGGTGNERILNVINPIADRLFVLGETTSSTGISTSGSFQASYGGGTASDVFIAEFSATSGTRVWGTYYGGSAIDRVRGVGYSTANGGSLVFGVTTQSTQLLASAGSYVDAKPGSGTSDNDAILCSLSLGGNIRNWATYIGGVGSDLLGDEILVAPNGDFYFSIKLEVDIPSFITAGSFIDTYSSTVAMGTASGYLAKFNSSGFPLNVSFFPINLSSIAFNSSQDIICHGQIQNQTNAIIGETLTDNAIQTVITSSGDYVCVISSDLTTLIYGTVIDNPNVQLPRSIVNLPYDNFFISGWTADEAQVPNSISTTGAYKEVASGGHDYYAVLICNSQVSITNSEPLIYTNGLSLSASNNFVTYTWSGQAAGAGQNFGISEEGTYYLTCTDYAGCVSKDTIIVTKPIVLGVDLINLSGCQKGAENKISWETITEKNSAYYSLEKSANGVDWEKVGELSAIGNSVGSQKYFLVDSSPFYYTYYRLINFDIDNTSSVSEIILVINEKENNYYNVYPNPTKGEFIVEWNSKIESNFTLEVIDIHGKIIERKNIASKNGLNNYEFNFLNLPAGVYFVNLLGENLSRRIKIIVN